MSTWQRPRVGLLALQNLARKAVEALSAGCAGNEGQGMIGYMLAQRLARTRLCRR